MKKRTGVLYISYDGMLEPLGESQVLGYLTKLSQDPDFEFTLISFEKRSDWKNREERKRLSEKIKRAGIHWVPLRYHRRPVILGTFWDIVHCTLRAMWLVAFGRIKIVHARSYVSSVPALLLKKLFRVRYVFDMRGFWADERADAGQWPREGRIYKTIKQFEKYFLLNADRVISLTEAAVREMKRFTYLRGTQDKFTVIPTCADFGQFQIKKQSSANSENFILGHVGSIGAWYLFNEAVLFFKSILKLKPDAKFLIINRNEHAVIREMLIQNHLPETSYTILAARHSDMNDLLKSLDGAVFFIKPLYSKIASAPTKLAELLGCGIPCIVNGGVGDMDLIFTNPKIGVCVKDYQSSTFDQAAEQLIRLSRDPNVAKNCRDTALEKFSSEQGIKDYLTVYRQILHSA